MFLYCCMETKYYLCGIIQNEMDSNKLKVVLTEEAQAFLDAQPFKAQQKIYYNIFKVEEGVMKVDIFKKLENTEIWEFRTLYNGTCYRLFSFWDTEQGTLVIATHGIVKKTQKTPVREIAKAERIRKEYFNNKMK
jgi:phage-related protein